MDGATNVNNPAIIEGEIDLSGYTIDLTGKNHNSLNKVVALIKLSLSNSASQTDITSANSIEFQATFDGLKPYYAKGFFGESNVHVGPSFTNIDIFKNVKSGIFELDKAKCKLEITNGIGADARLNISKISSVSINQTHELNSSFINKNININRAVDNPYGSSTKLLTFDETNSNIIEMIENMPNRIGYELDVALNPLGNVSNGTDFIYSDRLLKANLYLEIPLKVRTNKLKLQDTLKIDLDTNNQKMVDKAKLRLIAKNYFRQNINLNVYLIDETNHQSKVISSINNIKPYITEAENGYVNIDLNETNLKQLYKSKKIIIEVILDSESNFIEITNDSRIELK